ARAEERRAPAPQPEPAAAKDAQQTIFTGRVVDAAGKPLSGADVALAGRPSHLPGIWVKSPRLQVLARGKSDGQGRLRLTVPRRPGAIYYGVVLLAGTAGHGLAVRPLDLAAPPREARLELPPERVYQGRLVDLQGVAAAGVRLRVSLVRRD